MKNIIYLLLPIENAILVLAVAVDLSKEILETYLTMF